MLLLERESWCLLGMYNTFDRSVKYADKIVDRGLHSSL